MTECPKCGLDGKTVKPVTVRALLTEQQPITDYGWRFCNTPDCEVVYFSDDGHTFSKDQLNVPVGVKETSGERRLCYCFGHSVASIRDEFRSKEQSDALEDIRAKMKKPGCSCETKNPSGSCCLGSVAKEIETAKAKLNTPVNKVGTVARVGTVLSAIMASSCCWLPLVLLAIGVSGTGIAATLEIYRPLFVAVTIGFLGTAFYLTYLRKNSEDCCASDEACRPTHQRFNKLMLWIVTVLAVGFLFFPSYVGLLLSDQSPVTEGMDQTVLMIEGMTCAGCATIVEQALRHVPDVKAIEVNHETGRVVIVSDSGRRITVDEYRDALEKAGYQVRHVDEKAIGYSRR